MNRTWVQRTLELRRELAAIADDDIVWWLLAGGAAVAEPWPARPGYVVSDAEPAADTFIGYRAPRPHDPLRDAIDRAHAARKALRELDGTLPDQPLAVTVARDSQAGAIAVPSELDTAAFAIGEHCLVAALDDPTLGSQLAAVARGHAPRPWHGATPFVCVSIGDDPIEVARHAHRRAWRDGRGPWLGLGHSGDLATVSTCHLIVDGYGHATLTGMMSAPTIHARDAIPVRTLPRLAPIVDALPLGIAWRELPVPSPRALPLTYALGQLLYRARASAERRGAPRRARRFSPTLQIPVAPGRLGDPERRKRRAMASAISVRYEGGRPEPFDAFEARARSVLEREAAGTGLCARLIAAARAAPAPLAWKRKSFGAARPRWLDRISDVLGGRACLSRIRIDTALPPACAVSSPSRYASPADPFGACVVTVIDDGTRAAITVCGSGLAGTHASAEALLDQLLDKVAIAAPVTATSTRR